MHHTEPLAIDGNVEDPQNPKSLAVKDRARRLSRIFLQQSGRGAYRGCKH